MSEHKPDAKLVKTPVEAICGDPKTRTRTEGALQEVYGLPGPEGLSANGGLEFNLIALDVAPSGEKPSDSKQFKGVND